MFSTISWVEKLAITAISLVVLVISFVTTGYLMGHAKNAELKEENKTLAAVVENTQKNAKIQQESSKITRDTIVETQKVTSNLDKQAANRKKKTDDDIAKVNDSPVLDTPLKLKRAEEINFRSVWDEYCHTTGVVDAQCKIELMTLTEETQEKKNE